MRRLPDSELEIMLIIWNSEEAVSRTFIQKNLNNSKNLAPTTILSLLSRLEKKQFVRIEKKGKNNLYYPLVSQEEYAKKESQTILNRFFGNSLKDFVVQFNDSNPVDEEQIQELKEFLDSLTLEDSKQ